MEQMNIDFIADILPDSGWICVAQLLKGGGFKHYWYSQLEDAIARLEGLDRGGNNAYIAQAGFKMDGSRKQDNADLVRSCWLDIDCGVGKPFATQTDGAQALFAFCKESSLPLPSVVNSGNGLYAHWRFKEDVPAGLWRNTGKMLKDLTIQKQFIVDQSRTADTSSVLRPPGVHNWKDPQNPKPVKIIHAAQPIHHNEFHNLLVKALGIRAIPTRVAQHKIENEFAVAVTGPPADPEKVAEKCQQMNAFKARGGNVPEPLWYAMLCILRHCGDKGRAAAHDWSSGYSGYSAEETDRKLDQSDTGPSTCLYIASHNPELCLACRFQGRITSPINLGKPEPKALEISTDSPAPLVPTGYQVSEEGVFRRVEGEWELVYKHPVYVDSLVSDLTLGYEVVTIRHRDAMGKWGEVQLRSALVHDRKAFLMGLHDQHLQPPSGEMGGIFMYYLTAAIQHIRDSQPIQITSTQMGWVNGDEKKFILGSEMYAKDGSVQAFSFSRKTPEVVKAYHAKGSLELWCEATKPFAEPGFEAQAFAFVAGAFGAPLMYWTGFSGALISMVGKSGVGKSLTGNYILSTYGDPSKLIMLRDDTKNGMVARLGVYGSTPFYVDEVSNMTGEELSDFAYRVTQGRDKVRLTEAATERKNINEWNTIAIASTNHSIVERLASHKADASAEFNRIVEYQVEREFSREVATGMYRALMNNYGNAGVVYAKYLVEHQDEHSDKLDKLAREIDGWTNARNEERFWSATVACAIYGGLIAKRLGLIHVDMNVLLKWSIELIRNMRVAKDDSVQHSEVVFANIVDKYIGNTVVIANYRKGTIQEPYVSPKGRLEARIDPVAGHYWICKQTLMEELQRRKVSWSQFKNDLRYMIVAENMRMALGAGTWLSGERQACVQFKLAGTNLESRLEYTKEQFDTLGEITHA